MGGKMKNRTGVFTMGRDAQFDANVAIVREVFHKATNAETIRMMARVMALVAEAKRDEKLLLTLCDESGKRHKELLIC